MLSMTTGAYIGRGFGLPSDLVAAADKPRPRVGCGGTNVVMASNLLTLQGTSVSAAGRTGAGSFAASGSPGG